MTTKEKVKIVEKLIEHFKALDAADDMLAKCFGGTMADSPAINPSWCAFDGYVNAVGMIIGDKSGWLPWFIWDNECGAKGMFAGKTGKMRKVETVKQLIKIIEL
jgi:hypothetical protein